MVSSFIIKGIIEDGKSMAYTVKQLSDLSKTTVRTLHFYEELDLLKPAYYGTNGYRYYEEKELLRLQQILFFKELGFSLKQIAKVVGRDDFDQLAALYSHKNALKRQWEKIGALLKTIDKTIQHLKGKKKMKEQEMFDGFGISLVRQAKKETSYFAAEEIVVKSVRNPTKTAEEAKARAKEITKEAHKLLKELASCIEEGLTPSSSKVEGIIARHYAFTNQIHKASRTVYNALAQLYCEHPAFIRQLDPFHKELAPFMAKAMQLFADKNL